MPPNLVTKIRRKANIYKDSISLMQKVHRKKDVTNLISWSPLNDNWIDLNIDRTVKDNLNAGYEGVLRDNKGLWCGGFSHNMGTSTETEAELKSIHLGRQLAYDRRQKKIVLQIDNNEVYKDINKNASNINSGKASLHQIMLFHKRDWVVKLKIYT